MSNDKEQWDIDDLERYIKDVEAYYKKEIEEIRADIESLRNFVHDNEDNEMGYLK